MNSRPEIPAPEAVEAKIRDAAHSLLDLCLEHAPAPDQDAKNPGLLLIASVIDVAVQAIFMADHLQPGQDLKARRQGMRGSEIQARCIGLGYGVGSILASFRDPAGHALAVKMFTQGLRGGHSARDLTMRREGL